MGDLFSLAAAEEAQGRRRQMLRSAFGPTIAAALADPGVIEVMVNPDARLWNPAALLFRRSAGDAAAHAPGVAAARAGGETQTAGVLSGLAALIAASLAQWPSASYSVSKGRGLARCSERRVTGRS